MTLLPSVRESMNLWDGLRYCGEHERDEHNIYGDARDEIAELCRARNVEEKIFGGRAKDGQEDEYLEIVKEVWAKWHTTTKFNIGDKVYVDPGKPYRSFGCYIRATITDICDMGYLLRAFQQDLPGIYMFNIWDKDLSIRVDKSNKKLPQSGMISGLISGNLDDESE